MPSHRGVKAAPPPLSCVSWSDLLYALCAGRCVRDNRLGVRRAWPPGVQITALCADQPKSALIWASARNLLAAPDTRRAYRPGHPGPTTR